MPFFVFSADGMLFTYAIPRYLMANHMLTCGDSSWKRLLALIFGLKFSELDTLFPGRLRFFR